MEEDASEIRSMIEAMGTTRHILQYDKSAQDDYWALAGSRYKEFVREVNDCVEQRDADLTALHVG